VRASAGRPLVVGGDGLLGARLFAVLKQRGDAPCRTRRRSETADDDTIHLDLTQPSDRWDLPPDLDVAYLCAAETGLARCRDHPRRTRVVNVAATAALTQKLVSHGIRVVFPSSNLVFDGRRPMPAEDDPAAPGTAYGHQKAEAEKLLLEMGPLVDVVRLTKVVGPTTAPFGAWIGNLAAGRPVTAFDDMVLAPIALDFAVTALMQVADHGAGGCWHASADADITYVQAARHLARRLKMDPALVVPQSWRTAAHIVEPPAHTVLGTRRLKAALGLPAPSPWEALDALCPVR